MDSTDVICVVNDHIVIRRYRDEDAEVYAHHANNRNVWNTLSDRMPHPYTVDDAKAWIAHTRSPETQAVGGRSLSITTARRISAAYVIVVDGVPCGSISLEFGSGVYRLNATLGYWLGEEYHSKGIMSRAVPAFVAWAWQTFGYIVRLNATAYKSNTKSQRVLQKAGFVLESTRVNGCIKNGIICDEVTLGALRPESL
ncbi:hypothetical protein AMS68_002715 [Peltaster fructicola]|uniref:N-acetyltransferase domain-containing protein n=1 Tax=Peltaster fructicola TaxID=286661 RepID=A0A6H0XRC9_9PEZI|nr:hypothetical protein AMS68_002715 [Peltaster fructicola]